MGAFKSQALERTRPLIGRIRDIAGKHNATEAQVALNWLIHHSGETVFAIPGASNPDQAKSNARAMNISLTDEEMSILDQESKLV